MRREYDLLLQLRNDEEAHQRSRRRLRRLKRHALTKKVEHSILDFEQSHRLNVTHPPKYFPTATTTSPRARERERRRRDHRELSGTGSNSSKARQGKARQSKAKQRNHHWKGCHKTGSTAQHGEKHRKTSKATTRSLQLELVHTHKYFLG
jgi:hypothetical protein